MHKQFKHPDLKTLLWSAAQAGTKDDFNRCIADIKALSPACYTWLKQKEQDPSHRVDLYFKGRRYGHLTSNIAKAFNTKLMLVSEMPILAMFEEIHQQVMGWFAARRHSENTTVGHLVSGIARKIQAVINERARRYRYRQSIDTLFEIQSKETLAEYIVNPDAYTCSCRLWQTKVYRPLHQINSDFNSRDILAVMLLQFCWAKAKRLISTSSCFSLSIITPRAMPAL